MEERGTRIGSSCLDNRYYAPDCRELNGNRYLAPCNVRVVEVGHDLFDEVPISSMELSIRLRIRGDCAGEVDDCAEEVTVARHNRYVLPKMKSLGHVSRRRSGRTAKAPEAFLSALPSPQAEVEGWACIHPASGATSLWNFSDMLK